MPPTAVPEEITWASSNPQVASVTPNDLEGVVLAVEAGTADITAKCGAFEAKCTVTVIISAKVIVLDWASTMITVGGLKKLNANVMPSNTTDAVEWSSSDTSVATVDNDGLVKAIKVGTARITAKAGPVEAYCDVTVNEEKVEGAVDLGLSVKWASCNRGYYRSSTLRLPSLAWVLYIYNDDHKMDGSSFGRFYGYSIRPVIK